MSDYFHHMLLGCLCLSQREIKTGKPCRKEKRSNQMVRSVEIGQRRKEKEATDQSQNQYCDAGYEKKGR